jgi:hypothetical protein
MTEGEEERRGEKYEERREGERERECVLSLIRAVTQ